MIDRPRGAEPAAIVKTLARLSSRSDVARQGFDALLARTDVLGSLAREVRGTIPPPA